MSRTGFLHDVLGSVFVRGQGEVADPFAEPAGAETGAGWLARLGGRGADSAQPSLGALCEALLSERGEMSGNRIARALLARLAEGGEPVALELFALLASDFDLDADAAARAVSDYAREPTAKGLERLVTATEPRRQELLRRLNRLPGATEALVGLRVALLEHAREDAALARVDVDFRHLFRSWFNRGFLVLREIDWATPANVLEKIIEYEAVHAIDGFEALRARLEPPDRRCFAFFHPAMPEEPLIFVEVALVTGSPATVRELLVPERESIAAEAADTAVFYSISNCQRGLAGISFGHFLIKQVAAELRAQLPNLDTFRTLSPVPGLMRWVAATLEADASAHAPPGDGAGVRDGAEPVDRDALELARRVASGEGEPPDEAGRETLARLVARYLVDARREDGQPLDPVARFHLGNGASLDRVLPEADRFERGRRQSAGAMVSYLYDLPRVTRQHEAYAATREIAHSEAVRSLLAPPRRGRRKAS